MRCTSFNQGGRDYAKSLGITTKTDKTDCSIISRYINNTDMRVRGCPETSKFKHIPSLT